MSFNDALDLLSFRPNPVGFVPVDFRMAHRTISEFHLSDALPLPPASLAVCLPQALALADGFAGCNRFHVLDASDNLEVHAAVPLAKGGRQRPPYIINAALAAAAGTPAAHAAVTTAVAGHDRAAEAAARRVAHVDHTGEGVGSVD